eukprot:s1585_g1.t1
MMGLSLDVLGVVVIGSLGPVKNLVVPLHTHPQVLAIKTPPLSLPPMTGTLNVPDQAAEADHNDVIASMNSIILTGSLLALIAIGYRINTPRTKSLAWSMKPVSFSKKDAASKGQEEEDLQGLKPLPDAQLEVAIVGGGLVGLACALVTSLTTQGKKRIRVYDRRWRDSKDRVEWKQEGRRCGVVNLQSNTWSQLPSELQELWLHFADVVHELLTSEI